MANNYISRNHFIKTLALGSLSLSGFKVHNADDDLPVWQFENLRNQISEIIKIDSIELWKTQGQLLMVVRANGKVGVTQCNDRMQHLVSLLKGLVLPHFLGKDARDLPNLVDDAYRLNSNYKYAGMPLWNCIGSVEIACWDLLGKISQKPVYQLLGRQIRSEYDVYISDWSRDGDVNEIANNLLKKMEATGSRGVKIKVGGRMSNSKENTEQTKKYIPTLRKILGDKTTIYADANGSYSVKEGIETGRLLEDFGVEIFEEPCSFEDEDGMRQVTKALQKIKLAGGEQDSSVFRFERLARTDVYDILQPDLYYNGGILRALQVAKIAQKYSKSIAPHTPKADPLIAPFWQVAALTQNLYGLQECVFNFNEKPKDWFTPAIKIINGKMPIPTSAGLGIDYDPVIFKNGQRWEI
ncbi:MAG: mandelate racemase/muconate lactonizing enzyme family protein [Spirosomaceae bacterium]|nr:mandelate racemase/muconate lactonizing enzyme family protein [Spirosomataceae bacterium]